MPKLYTRGLIKEHRCSIPGCGKTCSCKALGGVCGEHRGKGKYGGLSKLQHNRDYTLRHKED